MMPLSGRAFPDADPGPKYSIYERASKVAKAIVDAVVIEDFIAFEGPATNARFKQEHTTAIRQALFDRIHAADERFIVIPPKSAKLALTGKGTATKGQMLNAASGQTRNTEFFWTLHKLINWDRKHQPEAEAIADAFGVARAAAKILFQRNAREGTLPSR